jgi:hypothetical protein
VVLESFEIGREDVVGALLFWVEVTVEDPEIRADGEDTPRFFRLPAEGFQER